MGATDCMFRLKGNTNEARIKYFWKVVADCKHEYGHGYGTGTAAEFSNITTTSLVFNTHEDLDKWLEYKSKNDAYLIQLKVIKDSPTITKWIAQLNTLATASHYEKDPKVRAKAQKEVEKIRAKIKAARQRKAEASKRTEFYAAGWVAE